MATITETETVEPSISIDELTTKTDGVAWQAVCWAPDCSWAGVIHHADEYENSDDPSDAAWAAAHNEGADHTHD